MRYVIASLALSGSLIAQVKFDGLTPVQLQQYAETISGKPQVIDRGCLQTPIRIQTETVLRGAALLEYVKECYRSAGLLWIDRQSFTLVGMAEDREDLLARENDVDGEWKPITETIGIMQADVSEIMDVLERAMSVDREKALQRTTPGVGEGVAPAVTPPSDYKQPFQQAPTQTLNQQVNGTTLQEKGDRMRVVRVGRNVFTGDIANRMITVQGTRQAIDRFREWVGRLDVRPNQIMMDVVISDCDVAKELNIGVDVWALAQKVGANTYLAGAAQFLGSTPVAVDTLKANNLFPKAGTGLTIYGKNEVGAAAVQALAKSGKFNVLQHPVLTSANDKLSTIYVGSQLPVATQSLTQGGINGGQTASLASNTQYISVRLQIDIIPHINQDGTIRLEMQETNNDVTSYTNIGNNAVPVIGEQGMRNTFVVPDGGVVIYGGLTTTRNTKTRQRVPVLGAIPVLGYLFGKSENTKERRQIFVAVRPTIQKNLEKIPEKEITERFK